MIVWTRRNTALEHFRRLGTVGDTVADQAEQTPPDDPVHDYVLDDQIGFLLRKAYQRNAVIFSEKVQTGLTPTQFAVMSRLSEITSVSQNQLGRLVGLDVATTKGVIDRLLGRNLVKSERDPNDRRRQLISLTAEGWAQFLATVPLGHEVTAETLTPLTQAEQKSLARLLKKIT